MKAHKPKQTRNLNAAIRKTFELGARAAADVAATYNGSTTHPLRLDDCILAKLNLATRNPRKNRERIQRPSQAFVAGMCLAIAETHRHTGGDSAACTVARDAGITLASARAAGVDPYDLKTLKKAGIK